MALWLSFHMYLWSLLCLSLSQAAWAPQLCQGSLAWSLYCLTMTPLGFFYGRETGGFQERLEKQGKR